MSDRAFVAAIRPNVYASSTTGVKKSAVTITAVDGPIRTTAPSSPFSTPTGRSSPGLAGPSSFIVSSSSPGGILQAQPPPCAYWVSRTPFRWVISANLVACPLPDGGRCRAAGSVGGGGVWVPGGPPDLQNRCAALSVAGGFDSRPPPLTGPVPGAAYGRKCGSATAGAQDRRGAGRPASGCRAGAAGRGAGQGGGDPGAGSGPVGRDQPGGGGRRRGGRAAEDRRQPDAGDQRDRRHRAHQPWPGAAVRSRSRRGAGRGRVHRCGVRPHLGQAQPSRRRRARGAGPRGSRSRGGARGQ